MKGKFLSYVKEPPLFVTLGVWFLSLVAIGGSLTLAIVQVAGFVSYLVYAGTAVLLAYGIYLAVKSAPALKKRFAELAEKLPFISNLINNYSFRTSAFSAVTFTINIGFAVFNGVLSIMWHSVWYGSLSAYYFLLSGVRCGAFVQGRRAKREAGGDDDAFLKKKYQILRNSGIALFVLEIALTVAVTQMVLSRKPVQESEIMAITTAVYTFYKVAFAIVNLVKAKKFRDPLVQTFRNIGLADAAVSLLSLQVTLIATFSEKGASQSLSALNAITGFTVCALTLVMGILMIVCAGKRLRKMKEGVNEDVCER